jgi:hypothetical protein
MGYLNAGIRWAFASNFYVEFNALDVLENKLLERDRTDGPKVGWSRELKLVYLGPF